MPFCHFSKVHEGTSWSELQANKQFQILRKCKEIEYSELATIIVDQAEFDQICSDISHTSNYYQKYAHQSIAALDGRWRCIIIKNQNNKQEIIIYTAGRLHPLYAAVCG